MELRSSSTVLRSLADLTGLSRLSISTVVGLLCVLLAFTIEYLFPRRDQHSKLDDFNRMQGWSPVKCGIGIGLLQLFVMIFFEKSLGISSGFTVFVAQLSRVDQVARTIPSLSPYTRGFSNYATVLFSLGAIAGSFYASYSSNEFPLHEQYGGQPWSSFIGGFLLLVGARCAGGCTSGQGISGVTHLLMGSIIATASMFAGGIIFAMAYGSITGDWQCLYL